MESRCGEIYRTSWGEAPDPQRSEGARHEGFVSIITGVHYTKTQSLRFRKSEGLVNDRFITRNVMKQLPIFWAILIRSVVPPGRSA